MDTCRALLVILLGDASSPRATAVSQDIADEVLLRNQCRRRLGDEDDYANSLMPWNQAEGWLAVQRSLVGDNIIQ